MNFFKTLKCLCCLAACSKYLYYAKKVLCIVAVLIVCCGLICNIDRCRAIAERLRGM